ncbi:MAG TPA: outer membrane protein transport protein [Candidatus Saccharimonadales bacterium]|nr:outer membrane protein transport protein [Candidatus Saccharimonadales bacterium]
MLNRTSTIRRGIVYLPVALLLSLAVIPAVAENAAYLQGNGVKSAGMAGTSLAYVQESTAAISNPAGMATVGTRCDIGSQFVYVHADSVFSGLGQEAPRKMTANPFSPIPEVGCNYQVNPKLTVGFTSNMGGAGASYGQPYFAGMKKAGSTFMFVQAAPTISYRLTPKVVIGVSPILAAERFNVQGSLVGITHNNAYAFGYGIRGGALVNVSKAITIGGSYTSKTNFTRLRAYGQDILAASGGRIALPDSYGVGVAFHRNAKATIAFDWVRFNWTTSPAFREVFQWKDQNVEKIGVSYAYNKDTTLRGGYSFAPQYFGTSALLNNFTSPLTNQQNVSVGATRKIGRHGEISGYYEYDFGGGGNVTGTGLSAGSSVKSRQMYMGVAYGYSFGR